MFHVKHNNMTVEKIIITQDFLITNKKFKIIKDKETNVLKTSPVPKEKDMSLYYNTEAYASYQEKPNNLVSLLYMGVRKISLKSKTRLVSAISLKAGDLLDFGCGLGGFLSAARTQGWSSCGIEPNQKVRMKAENTSGGVIFSTIREAQKTNKKYDVITMWHSLEHAADLKKTLSFLYSATKKKGKIVVAVPNHQSFDAKHYKKYWAAYDVPRHIWHFDQNSITNLFRKQGFVLERKHRMMWDAFYISILSEKYKKNQMVYFRAVIIGAVSNFLSLFTGESSSVTYVFAKESNT